MSKPKMTAPIYCEECEIYHREYHANAAPPYEPDAAPPSPSQPAAAERCPECRSDNKLDKSPLNCGNEWHGSSPFRQCAQPVAVEAELGICDRLHSKNSECVNWRPLQSSQPVAVPTPEEVARELVRVVPLNSLYEVWFNQILIGRMVDKHIAEGMAEIARKGVAKSIRDYTASLESRIAALSATLREVEEVLAEQLPWLDGEHKQSEAGCAYAELRALLSRIRSANNG